MTSEVKKKSYPNTKIEIQAIIVTLLFHVLLLGVFTTAKRTTSSEKLAQQQVTFVDFNNASQPSQKALVNWIEYHDPTLVAFPNSRFGYNKMALKKRLESTDVPEGSRLGPEKMLTPALNKYNSLALPLSENGKKAIPDMLSYDTTPINFFDKKQKMVDAQSLRYPLVLSDNRLIAVTLPESLLQNAKDIPNMPSIIKLWRGQGDELLPRYDIVKSCGNFALDVGAAVFLLAKLDKIFPKEQSVQVTILWQVENKT